MVPVGRSQRPIVSLKRASPENTVSSLSKIKETPPIECPGVGTTLNWKSSML